jgi:hypothetical protein
MGYLAYFWISILFSSMGFWALAQTDPTQNQTPEKTGWQKFGEGVNKVNYYTNLAVPVLSPLFQGDMKGVMNALGRFGQGAPHPQFQGCFIHANLPTIPRMCSFTPTSSPEMAASQQQDNSNILTFLFSAKMMYEAGKAQTDNQGNNNQGVACLKQQVANIDQSFEKMNKALDDSITKWKLATDALIKEVDAQKQKITDDYNLLYTGKNDKFNPVRDLLAQPGCEAMFEEDGIASTYIGQGENTQGQGGLMAIQKSEASRLKNTNEFLKNAPLIQKDLNHTLSELQKNIENTSINDLVSSNVNTADVLKGNTSDLSQYSILGSPSFSKGLKTALTDIRTEREGLINSFKEYMSNDSSDQEFINALRTGGDAQNKKALFTAWQNQQERKCIYRELGATDDASFEKKLYLLAAPKDARMRQFDCGTQKSCSNYVRTVMNSLTNDQDGQGLSTKITKVSANSNVSVQNVYTFKTPQNPAARYTLGQLLRGIENKCKKTMSLNKASYSHVVNKVIAPAIKKLEQQDKNLRKNIMAKMRNELMECKGKPINYGSCKNTLPNNSDSPFCFKQASICATNVKSCSQRLEKIIDLTRGQIKINATNINAKVKTLKDLMHTDLISKMSEVSKVADVNLNIAALSKYAGYQTTKNEFTFGSKKSQEDPNAFFKGFEKLEEAPLNIKISDPAHAAELYAENIEMLKDKYSAMKNQIMKKMNEEIAAITANYENALKIINEAIQQCNGVSQQMAQSMKTIQDNCVNKQAKDQTKRLMETITGSYTSPSDICKEGDNKNDENNLTWINLKEKDLEEAGKTCSNKLKKRLPELGSACKAYQDKKRGAKTNDEYKEQQEDVQKIYDKLSTSFEGCIQSEKEADCIAVHAEMSPKIPGPAPDRSKNTNKKVDEN